MGGMPSVGGLSKGSLPVFTQVSEKTTENSERLGRQARPEIEPDTSRLPALSTEPHATGKAVRFGSVTISLIQDRASNNTR